jgi:hypothetical protein
MPNKHCKRGYRCYESESSKPPKRQRPAPVALESRPPQQLLFQTDGRDNTRSRPSIKSAAGRCRFVQAAEAAAMTTPHGARLMRAWCVHNGGSEAVESSFLGDCRPVCLAAFLTSGFHPNAAPMAGRRISVTTQGCPRQLSNAPAGRAAVESLSRGERNVTLEAHMVIAGRGGPRRVLAGGRAP